MVKMQLKIKNLNNGQNATKNNDNSFIGYLEKKGAMNIGKDVVFSSIEGAVGKQFVDKLSYTYKLGNMSAKNFGPASNLIVKVGTTPTSTLVLKNVYKVGGPMTVLGVGYDVYANYDTFGYDKDKFMQANLADGLKHGSAVIAGGVASTLGAPVMLAAVVGVGVYYWVDANFTTPYKENLQK